MKDPVICHVICKACGGKVGLAMSRYSGPVAVLHTRKGKKACRIIVEPSHFGSKHRQAVVPDHVTIERALEYAVSLWLEAREPESEP